MHAFKRPNVSARTEVAAIELNPALPDVRGQDLAVRGEPRLRVERHDKLPDEQTRGRVLQPQRILNHARLRFAYISDARTSSAAFPAPAPALPGTVSRKCSRTLSRYSCSFFRS